MAITLNNLDKWKSVANGELLTFHGDKMRRIRLQLNTSARTNVHLSKADGTLQFLGVVNGFEVIDFIGHDDVELMFSTDGEAYLYCGEFEVTSSKIVDAESFAKIYERRERNPDLEYMLHRMQNAQEQRIAAIVDQYEARFTGLLETIEDATARVPNQEDIQGLPEQGNTTGDGLGDDLGEAEGNTN